MSQFKNSGGDISQPFGSVKISDIIPMWLSKFKKVLNTTWKRPMMKLKFFKKLLSMLMTPNGVKHQERIAMSSNF